MISYVFSMFKNKKPNIPKSIIEEDNLDDNDDYKYKDFDIINKLFEITHDLNDIITVREVNDILKDKNINSKKASLIFGSYNVLKKNIRINKFNCIKKSYVGIKLNV